MAYIYSVPRKLNDRFAFNFLVPEKTFVLSYVLYESKTQAEEDAHAWEKTYDSKAEIIEMYLPREEYLDLRGECTMISFETYQKILKANSAAQEKQTMQDTAEGFVAAAAPPATNWLYTPQT